MISVPSLLRGGLKQSSSEGAVDGNDFPPKQTELGGLCLCTAGAFLPC